MVKFTLQEFKKKYPDDKACLDRIFQLRYGHLKNCPSCGEVAAWRRVSTRRCYQCRHCYEQFYPTAGTIFERSRVPISYWFYTIWLFTTTRNGVAAKEIERQLGCHYETAWRMGHQIRKLMNKIGEEKLRGFVELDETYVTTGKKEAEVTGNKLVKGEQTPVFGMVQRMGDVVAYVVPSAKKEELYPLIHKHVDKTSHLSTDELKAYVRLPEEGYNHFTVKHSMKQYRVESASTNTIEGYFSQLKRTIKGSHLHVSMKYLQNYVGEVSCRYNNRHEPHLMFENILKNLPEA